MRTLGEIITSAKDGHKPSHDECYWAMLALSALHHFDHHALLELVDNGQKSWDSPLVGVDARTERSFERFKSALDVAPDEYMGWDYAPSNPEYQKQRRIALKIADMAIKGELPNQKK